MTICEFYLKEQDTNNPTSEIKKFNHDSLIKFIHSALKSLLPPFNSSKKIIFNFDDCIITDEFKIIDLFEKICLDLNFTSFSKCLNGKNKKYNLFFSFRKTIFEDQAKFDQLSCVYLDLYNVVFEKGALLRGINIEKVVYQPWKLGADVTFGYIEDKNHIEFYSIIHELKFRHNLEGDGWTYFIGTEVLKSANFKNTVLNKVHFSNMDMSRCYFANAIIQDTRFVNCNFPKSKDLWTGAIVKKKFNQITPKVQGFFLCLVFCVFFIFIIFVMHNHHTIVENNKHSSYSESVLLLSYILSAIFLMAFNNYSFMFLNRLFNRYAEHFSTADETDVFSEKNPGIFSKKISNLREIYKQLRTNFEGNNDYQMAGEFYFSQRHIELAQFDYEDPTKSLTQQILMNTFHWINGFGERWIKPLIWFILTIILFAYIHEPNKDFISTATTPKFLMKMNNEDIEIVNLKEDYIVKNKILVPLDMKISFKESNIRPASTINEVYTFKDQIIQQYLIALNSKDFTVKFIYSASQFTAPFISSEKQWFKVFSLKGYVCSFIESILLWIFAFSFAVAIKNRIKR